MNILDPRFIQRLAWLLQSKGTNTQGPTEMGVLGAVITIPAELVLERAGSMGELKDLVWGTGADPAAGQPFILGPVPAGEAWLLRQAFFRAVTSAVVANRFAFLSVDADADTNKIVFMSSINQAITNGQTWDISAGNQLTALAGGSSDIQLSLPIAYIPAGAQVRLSLRGIQVADQISRVRFQYQRFSIPQAA